MTLHPSGKLSTVQTRQRRSSRYVIMYLIFWNGIKLHNRNALCRLIWSNRLMFTIFVFQQINIHLILSSPHLASLRIGWYRRLPQQIQTYERPKFVHTIINQEHVKNNHIMLYMKGKPSQPQCGFSGKTIQILQKEGVDFSSVNVLDYPVIRDAVKKYS